MQSSNINSEPGKKVTAYFPLQYDENEDNFGNSEKTVDAYYDGSAYLDVRALSNVQQDPNNDKTNVLHAYHKQDSKVLSLPAVSDNISVGQCIVSLPNSSSVVSNIDQEGTHYKNRKSKHEFRQFNKGKRSLNSTVFLKDEKVELHEKDTNRSNVAYIDAHTAVKDYSNTCGSENVILNNSLTNDYPNVKLNHHHSTDSNSSRSDNDSIKLFRESYHQDLRSNKEFKQKDVTKINETVDLTQHDHGFHYNKSKTKTHTTNFELTSSTNKPKESCSVKFEGKLSSDNNQIISKPTKLDNHDYKYLNMAEDKVDGANMVEMRKKVTIKGDVQLSKPDETEDDEFLNWIKKQFVNVAGEDHSIDKEEFKHALGIKNNYFAERFFTLFDIGNSGTIDMTEFINGVTLLAKGSPKEKLKFLFDAYDVDGNGAIDPEELKTVMQHCVEESDMKLSDEALEALTVALFESADADGSGMISFDELCAVLQKYPDVMNNLTISAAKWLKPPKKEVKRPACSSCCGGSTSVFNKQYFVNNRKIVIWTIIYVLVNIGLFSTCVRYRNYNAAVIIARGCGMCLNFNCAFILVLVLNGTLTMLRMTPMKFFLPIDDNVYYHRCVGYFIVVLSVVHTVAHYVNVALTISEDNQNVNSTLPTNVYWEYVLTLKSGVGFVGPGFGYLSGLILDVVLLVMFVCALPCIRRNGYFEVFYFTHLLYIVFWIFLILHGPIFWMFFIVPGVIFVIEKTIPPLLRRATGTTFYIKQVTLLPSKVTHLVINHSKAFHFKPGDYVFIKIPEIAKFEYHPFTISSAPQRKGEFWLHIRSAGHWTNRLYKYFEDYGTEGFKIKPDAANRASVAPFWQSSVKSRKSRAMRESMIDVWKNKMKTKKVNIRVSIRGPYGTPTRDIYDTEHAVLIACGIGVTPFASILQSIMYEVRQMKKTCPHCYKSFLDMDKDKDEKMKLKKVDFLWINRQHRCFEWFVSLLQQLEREEHQEESFDNFLDMQMYMTSALSMNDMKGFGLQLAIDAMEKKGQRNVVTGLKKSFKPGRPNWKEVFADIKKNRKGNVKVFFCGNPTLAKILKQHCDQHGFEFSKESF